MEEIERIKQMLTKVEQSAHIHLTFQKDLSLTNPSYLCLLEPSPVSQEIGSFPKQQVVLKLWGNLRKHALSEHFQPILEQQKLPMPRTLAFGRTTDHGQELGYTITEYVPYAQAEACIGEWGQSEQRKAYQQAGEWLKQLHKLFSFTQSGKLERRGDGSWSPSSSWKPFLIDDILRWRPWIEAASNAGELLSEEKELFQKLTDRFVEQANLELSSEPEEIVLCHRDYHARNWLVDPVSKRLTHIIDFEHMFAADPVFDFQRIHTYCLLHNRNDLWLAFCQGYGVESKAIEPRSFIYVLHYGLGSAGYAIKVKDSLFYEQSIKLLKLLDASSFASGNAR